MDKYFDVIVAGLGAMGSACCYYLAKAGVKVLGIEQFESPHALGSHSGQSRLIRKAYYEHADYVPLLERSYLNWQHLEQISGEQVFYKTGVLYLAKPTHSLNTGIRFAAKKYGIELQDIAAGMAGEQYAGLNIPPGFEYILEPDAGFLLPEKAIRLYCKEAVNNKAVLSQNTRINSWKSAPEGILLETTKETFRGKKLIFTAGAWTGQLLPKLAEKLKVTRQVLIWIEPPGNNLFALGNFPCFAIGDEHFAGLFYGFPVLPKSMAGEFPGFKIAYHHQGQPANPDEVNRVISPEDIKEVQYALKTYFPHMSQNAMHQTTCLYTNTPDHHFIIDFLPGYSQDVVIAAGFSGHGFKFASAVGDVLSDLAILGKTSLPVDFLSLDRFKEQ